jgi:DNA-binding LytR/AlgR family response regulator
MRIAVLDDEKEEREQTKEYVRRFCQEFHTGISMDEYESAERLLQADLDIYEIIIFDIELGGMSGMEAARQIRKSYPNVVMLFITNMAQFAIEGYEVEAVDYVLKPVTYADFSLKFQKAMRKAAGNKENFILLDCVEGLRRISISGLLYVEVMAHYLIYHTKDRQYKLRGSMKECETELRPYYFTRVHKSYLVNLAYVDNIKSSDIVLTGGEMIPIGKVYRETLLQQFMSYVQGGSL